MVEEIKSPYLPELKSVLNVNPSKWSSEVPATAKLVLGQIVRREQQPLADLFKFFDKSLRGNKNKEQINTALRWLCDGQRLLAWEKDEQIGATRLGQAVSRTGVPFDVGAGFGSLIRDILICDAEASVLQKWKPLDTLIVLELLSPREKGLKRFSKKLPEQVDGWIERHTEKPIL